MLRSATTIPLSAGQMDGHSHRFREWIDHDAIDIFMPNSLYNGGMTETRRVAYLAQIYNRPLSDAGGGGIFCLHHVAGFRNGTLAECHLGVEQVERRHLHRCARAGRTAELKVPDAPGFGVSLNRDGRQGYVGRRPRTRTRAARWAGTREGEQDEQPGTLVRSRHAWPPSRWAADARRRSPRRSR